MFGMGGECRKRNYSTPLDKSECVASLQKKDWRRDLFQYDFYEVEGEFFILFRSYMNRNLYSLGNLHSVYQIAFEPDESFRIGFEDFRSFPCLGDGWLDAFFLQKLRATPQDAR